MRAPRPTVWALSVLLAVAAGSVWPATPARAAGHAGICRDATGVTVVIDFGALGGGTIVRCAPDFGSGSGLDALKRAGIDHDGVRRWGDGFICRIQGRPAAAEKLRLTNDPSYQERCIDTPPAAAYWSYWWATDGGSWTYSQYGVKNRRAIPGGFEGWSFSLNAGAQNNPRPGVTPKRPAPVTPTPAPTTAASSTRPPSTRPPSTRPPASTTRPAPTTGAPQATGRPPTSPPAGPGTRPGPTPTGASIPGPSTPGRPAAGSGGPGTGATSAGAPGTTGSVPGRAEGPPGATAGTPSAGGATPPGASGTPVVDPTPTARPSTTPGAVDEDDTPTGSVDRAGSAPTDLTPGAEPTPGDADLTGDAPWGTWIGIGAVVVAAITAALLAWRRRRA